MFVSCYYITADISRHLDAYIRQGCHKPFLVEHTESRDVVSDVNRNQGGFWVGLSGRHEQFNMTNKNWINFFIN